MACFPRFRGVFPRHKNSYNPAVDENTDTILNNSDNPVQIGRYIRREETPVFTPKISERSRQLQQKQLQQGQQQPNDSLPLQQQQQHNENTNHIGSNNINDNKNLNSINNTTSTTSRNASSNSINNTPAKKFISNINRSNSNKPSSIARNSSINSNGNGNFAALGNHTHTKLKPVKGRRPTALPCEVPQIEEDNESSSHIKLNGGLSSYTSYDDIDHPPSAYAPNTPSTPVTPPTPGSVQGVKFFIGNGNGNDGDTNSNADLSMYGGNSAATSRNNSGAFKRQPLQLAEGTTATPSTTSSRNPSVTSTFMPPRKSTIRSKYGRRTRTNEPSPEELNIPTPPPMPPQTLLATSESTMSLISLRKSLRAAKLEAAALATATATATAADAGTEAAAAAANDKCSFDRQMCTIAEVLNISNPSTTTGISINGRDSGVQVEDPTPSPKDSDNSDGTSSQAHRIDGGIIFTRPHLTAKQDVHIAYIEKTEAQRQLIRQAIERNDFLNNYMDKARKEMVIDAMAPAFYEMDSFIIRENAEGSEIYVSEEGQFEVLKGDKVVGSFGPATVFGELAILYNANRLASVRATTNAHVWKITRETFRQIMLLSESKEREENLQFLRTVPLLNDLSVEVLNKVVDLLRRKYFKPNTCIVREGEVGNEFFIILGGTVTITKKNEEGEAVVARRKRGEYFGEQALLNADRRQASVYADPPGTEVLLLEREAFISYLGTIPQLREKPSEQQTTTTDTRSSNRKIEFDNEYAHLQLKDLEKIATIGAGAFGKVDLVAYREKTFALKIIKKIDVIKQDQVEHVYSEKHVMMKCRSSPFIIELYKTFRNEKYVYFLMEACMGGDVWTIMSQKRFFHEKTARFIAGCVVEAFDYLHSHNIIYRDLKPENLMLTTDGYCKLVDFGFAKHIPPNQKTNTFAGTPEYVAPEIILDRGHDRAVDYWALGILIFELLVGKTPFRGQNQIKIYQQILGGIDVIQMPSKIPKSAQGLIKHLCKQLPAERLGYQRKGILDIKRHSWFDSLDWNKLKYKQLPSPIKRPISSNTDLQYFGLLGMDNDYEPPDETSGWDIDF